MKCNFVKILPLVKSGCSMLLPNDSFSYFIFLKFLSHRVITVQWAFFLINGATLIKVGSA